ncbi:MBL fold metallo-hydrolase [Paenibacillus hexagrammi]|uniref:MBL fold metallo-hydrolase n=1 Tax=Paenibacillus hexagrammi TaxID=2908839 RepID=A0ABY3SBZ9_9BACL|nr:MBL fold metallo-hydrolase [Paenibacillus sp. YPD9-1]UJF31451.1 MBL fold metallo-hydrolase [Paenibacillus sp. YPD9-1]
MRIIQKDTIHQITFYNRQSLSVNCYFVEEEDSLTLVDTAVAAGSHEILQFADKIGKPITRILLTHLHHDHVGGLDALKEMLPDAIVYISGREARLMSGDYTLDPEELDTPILGIIPNNLKTRADVLLKDGDQIGSLIALSAPGHTPGSMAFFDTRNKNLIAGDTFQTEGGIAVAGQLRPLFPFLSKNTWDKQASLASALKLREYSPLLLAVGHGEMLELPCADMDRAIKEAECNLELEK